MRKTILTLIVLLSLLFTGNICYAGEYPIQENHYHDRVNIIERIYELDTDQEPSAEAKQSFERDGYFYTLVSITQQSKPLISTKEYKETIAVESASKNIGDVLPLLAKEKHFTTADGYQGSLKLDESSIAIKPKGYKTNSKTLNATRTYPNLLNADLAFIPKTITENGTTLELATISWEDDLTYNPADYTVGPRYKAEATYQGTKTTTAVTGYVVTAAYSGTVEKITAEKDVYTLTFSGKKEMPWLFLIAALGGAVAALGSLLFFKWWRQSRLAKEDEDEENEEDYTTERTDIENELTNY